MSRMNESAEQTGESTAQLKDKATEVSQNLRDLGGQVRDAATEKYTELRDQATQYYDQSRDAAMQWEESLEKYVQEQPLKAVLIAAGVGVLLGVLWKRS